MGQDSASTWWEQFIVGLARAGDWIARNQDALRAFTTWATVNRACQRARLYAPMDAEAWRCIEEAALRGLDSPSEYETLIFSLYSPTGIGHSSLRLELAESPALRDRQRETGQVLDSLADGRHYVTVCGALPLVEYVLSSADGKWTQPGRYQLDARLDEPGAMDPESEALLLVEAAAVEMVRQEIPRIWKSGPHHVGRTSGELNRHLALHGTGVGWDDAGNAVRSILLLAATARVAGPMLAPRG